MQNVVYNVFTKHVALRNAEHYLFTLYMLGSPVPPIIPVQTVGGNECLLTKHHSRGRRLQCAMRPPTSVRLGFDTTRRWVNDGTNTTEGDGSIRAPQVQRETHESSLDGTEKPVPRPSSASLHLVSSAPPSRPPVISSFHPISEGAGSQLLIIARIHLWDAQVAKEKIKDFL